MNGSCDVISSVNFIQKWDFKSNTEYTQILENLGKYYGNLYLQQLKKQFPKFFL